MADSESRIAPLRLAFRRQCSSILSLHTAYKLIPDSGKVVVFDSELPVKHALVGLMENNIKAAPVWDSERRMYTGMVTVTDFIDIVVALYDRQDNKRKQGDKTNNNNTSNDDDDDDDQHRVSKTSVDLLEELDRQRICDWAAIKREQGTSIPTLVHILPDGTLLDAVRMLVANRIHRLPVLHRERENTVLGILSHHRIFRFLLDEFDRKHKGVLVKAREAAERKQAVDSRDAQEQQQQQQGQQQHQQQQSENGGGDKDEAAISDNNNNNNDENNSSTDEGPKPTSTTPKRGDDNTPTPNTNDGEEAAQEEGAATPANDDDNENNNNDDDDDDEALYNDDQPAFLKLTVRQLGLGTFGDDVAKISYKTPLLQALRLMSKMHISAVPVVNRNGVAIDAYTRSDVRFLAQDRTFDVKSMTVGMALSRHRNDRPVPICTMDDTIGDVLRRLVSTGKHRILCVGPKREFVGLLSLSDVLFFIVDRSITTPKSSRSFHWKQHLQERTRYQQRMQEQQKSKKNNTNSSGKRKKNNKNNKNKN